MRQNKIKKRQKKADDTKKITKKRNNKKGQIPILITKSGKYVSPYYKILDPDFDIDEYDRRDFDKPYESYMDYNILYDQENIEDEKYLLEALQ